MAHEPADEPIRQAVAVPVPVERAFAAFAAFADLAGWWPTSTPGPATPRKDIGIEPREGGHCYERGPYGLTCHWAGS